MSISLAAAVNILVGVILGGLVAWWVAHRVLKKQRQEFQDWFEHESGPMLLGINKKIKNIHLCILENEVRRLKGWGFESLLWHRGITWIIGIT